MTPFSRPLIALSLTEPDEGVLHYAAMLANLFQWRDVHFAHVVPPVGSGQRWEPQRHEEQMRAEVERLYGQPTSDDQVYCHAAAGSRLDELLRLSVEHERDLVVLGHRRMRSGRRALARRLAKVSPSSVWLAPEGSTTKIRSILVPIDFSEHSADALVVAIHIARAAEVEVVRALHVFFDPSTIRYDEHVDEILGQEEEAFEKFMADIDTHGIEVEPVFHESTHPAEAIMRVAERSGKDLIVMNTRGRSHAASVLLGSTTSEAMAATTIPLLAVKHYGDRMTLLQALVNHRIWEQKNSKTN